MRKKQSFFLIFLIVVTYVCNLFDLWYTLYVVENVSNASEANPVMEWMLNYPIILFTYKYAVIPLFLIILYCNREHRIARVGIYICAAVFIFTVVYQVLSIPNWSMEADDGSYMQYLDKALNCGRSAADRNGIPI